MLNREIKYLIISLLMITVTSYKAQAQWMMSFNGTYDLLLGDVSDNYENQYSANVNLHYKWPEKPFEAYLGAAFTPFRATSEVEDFFETNTFSPIKLEYNIQKYSAPLTLNFKYYPLDLKKLQAYASVGFGAHYLADKVKITTDHTSKTELDSEWQTMLKADIGVVYKIEPDLGIQLSAGYLNNLKEESLSYLKLGLGIIYHI